MLSLLPPDDFLYFSDRVICLTETCTPTMENALSSILLCNKVNQVQYAAG